MDFAAYLVKTCVIEEAGVSNTEFYNVIEALGKVLFVPLQFNSQLDICTHHVSFSTGCRHFPIYSSQ